MTVLIPLTIFSKYSSLWIASVKRFLYINGYLVSAWNRKWQEASQQIQTLQASQTLMAEYEQKIKVRNFVTHSQLFLFHFYMEKQAACIKIILPEVEG